MKKWVLYIVRCKDNSLYTGITIDLKKRIKVHNQGKGAKYTRSRRPVRLLYRETCRNESNAKKREIKIKKFSRKNKLKLIQGSPD